MIDFSKGPYRRLNPEEQKEFERRAKIVDDNNNPPITRKKDQVKRK